MLIHNLLFVVRLHAQHLNISSLKPLWSEKFLLDDKANDALLSSTVISCRGAEATLAVPAAMRPMLALPMHLLYMGSEVHYRAALNCIVKDFLFVVCIYNYVYKCIAISFCML